MFALTEANRKHGATQTAGSLEDSYNWKEQRLIDG